MTRFMRTGTVRMNLYPRDSRRNLPQNPGKLRHILWGT